MVFIKNNVGWDVRFSCWEGSQLLQVWRIGGKFIKKFFLN